MRWPRTILLAHDIRPVTKLFASLYVFRASTNSASAIIASFFLAESTQMIEKFRSLQALKLKGRNVALTRDVM